MNSKIFNAVLAMDAYNRGYGASLELPTVIGTTKLGNATPEVVVIFISPEHIVRHPCRIPS